MDTELRRKIDELINGVLHPDKEPVYEGWLKECAIALRDELNGDTVRTPEQEVLLEVVNQREQEALRQKAGKLIDSRIEAHDGKDDDPETVLAVIAEVRDEIAAT